MNEPRVQKRCACPICATNEALRRARAALDLAETAAEAWVAHGADNESSLYYLLDETRAAAEQSPRKARKRIRAALKLLDKQPTLPWMDAVPAMRDSMPLLLVPDIARVRANPGDTEPTG